MKIFRNVSEMVGNTPFLRLNRITDGSLAQVVAKLEYYNPAKSVKDLIGLSMIEARSKRAA